MSLQHTTWASDNLIITFPVHPCDEFHLITLHVKQQAFPTQNNVFNDAVLPCSCYSKAEPPGV